MIWLYRVLVDVVVRAISIDLEHVVLRNFLHFISFRLLSSHSLPFDHTPNFFTIPTLLP